MIYYFKSVEKPEKEIQQFEIKKQEKIHNPKISNGKIFIFVSGFSSITFFSIAGYNKLFKNVQNLPKNQPIKENVPIEISQKIPESEKTFLDSVNVIKKLRNKSKNYEFLLNRKAFYELNNEKGIYIVGDLDGDIIREILAGIISGHLAITKKGLDILLILIKENEKILKNISGNSFDKFKKWEKSDLIFNKSKEILKEIKARESKNQLIFLGDCIFDRLANNIEALLEPQEKLSEKGVIHITGNHDNVKIAYTYYCFAYYIPENRRPDLNFVKKKLKEFIKMLILMRKIISFILILDFVLLNFIKNQ